MLNPWMKRGLILAMAASFSTSYAQSADQKRLAENVNPAAPKAFAYTPDGNISPRNDLFNDVSDVQTFLPIPDQADARPKPMNQGTYNLQRVGENSYVVTAGTNQNAFVVTSKGVVVIDAPPALETQLPAAIRKVTNLPVTHVIITHDHYDHIGAAKKLFPQATFVAHQLTADHLKNFPDPERPQPTVTFSGERYVLTVGGVPIELIYPGQNHDTGNILVYVPSSKLAVMTDLVMPGWIPYRNWGNADSIPGILKAHDAILKLDFTTYVGGHVYRTGTRYDVQQSREYWNDMWAWTNEAIASTPEVRVSDPDNAWAANKAWQDAVADKVTARLIAKWKDRLAGTDTFTHATVVATIISIFTDNPKLP